MFKPGLTYWHDLGMKRIDSILNTYSACTHQQLQMKISEAGPTNQRVEPAVLSACIKEKLKNKLIEYQYIDIDDSHKQRVYYMPDVDRRALNPRLKKIQKALSIYINATEYESLCGNVLEYIITQSICNTGLYNCVVPVFNDNIDGIVRTSSPDLCSCLNGKETYNRAPLDGFLIHKKTSLAMGIEIKNKREWKYPQDYEIWDAIAKCASLDILPIFVARKLSEVTKFFFSKAGILGLETQFQFIHPCKEIEFKPVISKLCLGYSDIKFLTVPIPHINKFFIENIPENMEVYYKRFMDNKLLLLEYAINHELADESLIGYNRTKEYNKINKLIPPINNWTPIENKSNNRGTVNIFNVFNAPIGQLNQGDNNHNKTN